MVIDWPESSLKKILLLLILIFLLESLLLLMLFNNLRLSFNSEKFTLLSFSS